MKLLSKFGLLLFLAIVFQAQTQASPDCKPRTIVKPDDKDLRVKYYHNKWHTDLPKPPECKKSGSDKYWTIPKRDVGAFCAKPRVDGCSYGKSSFAFSDRDKKLMTPSCNQHDLCYNTYNTKKETCDKQFRDNLYASQKEFGSVINVEVIYQAVVHFGNHDHGQDWGKEHDCKYPTPR